MTSRISSLRSQRGFTLIEVLIAVIVLSIGLLGLASLQASGLKNDHNSYLRSQASFLAYDIIDRMRANSGRGRSRAAGWPPGGTALGGAYDIGFGDSPSSTVIATEDLTAWKNALAATLPGPGDGSIVTLGNVVTVTVQWDDRDENRAGGAPMQFQVQSQL